MAARFFKRRRSAFVTIALTAIVCVMPALADDQTSAFVRAAERGDLTEVNALLKAGVEIDAEGVGKKFPNRSTALIEASRNERVGVMQALLAAKADVNAKVRESTALAVATSAGNLAAVRILLAAKADPNLKTSDNRPPLVDAAERGSADIVEALLKASAVVDVKYQFGTPLYLAAQHDRPEVVRLLLAARANVDAIRTSDNSTPILAAAASAKPEVAQLLIQGGANVHAMTNRGVTPLMLAAGRGNLDLVQLLLAAKADANGGFRVCDNFKAPEVRVPPINAGPVVTGAQLLGVLAGGSPLGAAAAAGNQDIVRALIAAHADVNRAQCDGKIPLALAVENGHPEVATLLRSAGATQ